MEPLTVYNLSRNQNSVDDHRVVGTWVLSPNVDCKNILAIMIVFPSATFDKITVEIDGENYQLKAVGQLGMPNPQTIIINMASYPQVKISPLYAYFK